MKQKTFRMGNRIQGVRGTLLGLSLMLAGLGLTLTLIGFLVHNDSGGSHSTVHHDGSPAERGDRGGLGMALVGAVLFSGGVLGWRYLRRTQPLGRLILSSSSVTVDYLSQNERFDWDDVATAEWKLPSEHPDSRSEVRGGDGATSAVAGVMVHGLSQMASDFWMLEIRLNSRQVVYLLGSDFLAPEKAEAALKAALVWRGISSS